MSSERMLRSKDANDACAALTCATGDSVWVGLFLIAVCAITIGFISPPRDAENTAFVWGGVLATSAVAVAFMTFIVIRGDFGLGEWQLYGLLAIGAIVLVFGILNLIEFKRID